MVSEINMQYTQFFMRNINSVTLVYYPPFTRTNISTRAKESCTVQLFSTNCSLSLCENKLDFFAGVYSGGGKKTFTFHSKLKQKNNHPNRHRVKIHPSANPITARKQFSSIRKVFVTTVHILRISTVDF